MRGYAEREAGPHLGPDFEKIEPTFPMFIFSSFDLREELHSLITYEKINLLHSPG